MKATLAPALLAALGFAVAGCASGQGGAATITVRARTTLSRVKTGKPITCTGGSPIVEVPSGRATVVAGSGAVGKGGSGPSPTTRLRLTRSLDGTVTVACTRK